MIDSTLSLVLSIVKGRERGDLEGVDEPFNSVERDSNGHTVDLLVGDGWGGSSRGVGEG